MNNQPRKRALSRGPVRCPEAIAERERDAFLGQLCRSRYSSETALRNGNMTVTLVHACGAECLCVRFSEYHISDTRCAYLQR